MLCREFNQNLSLYVDDALSAPQREACDEHLQICPLCRAEAVEMQALRHSLRAFEKPQISPELTETIRRSVATEIAAERVLKRKTESSAARWHEWLGFRLMPFSVGTLASILLFAMMFTALRASMTAFQQLETSSVVPGRVLAASLPPRYDTKLPFSAADYAALRSSYAIESPSLNPRSAFVAFTSSLARGEVNDDAVVVVADVFSNGVARVASVVEPPNNLQTLAELERILQNEPAFVPATYDKRPENLRVVLLIQKVNVNESANNGDDLKTRKF